MVSSKVNTGNEARYRNNLSAVEERAIDTAFKMAINPATVKDAIFQHSFLCQTYLPYRNPGNHVSIWNQKQGNVNLAIQSTQVLHPLLENMKWQASLMEPKPGSFLPISTAKL